MIRFEGIFEFLKYNFTVQCSVEHAENPAQKPNFVFRRFVGHHQQGQLFDSLIITIGLDCSLNTIHKGKSNVSFAAFVGIFQHERMFHKIFGTFAFRRIGHQTVHNKFLGFGTDRLPSVSFEAVFASQNFSNDMLTCFAVKGKRTG
mmetsp:Transcript_59645/g.172172  ORF Transcript_59645/g.172172 Transcript_59645/m.172172 type:complete len:146 (-) Transcript_59645:721-1158(-)